MIVARLSRRKYDTLLISKRNPIAVIAIGAILVMFVYSNRETTTSMERYLLRATVNEIMVDSTTGERRRSMKEWRDLSKHECNELITAIGKKFDADAIDRKEALERSFVSKITLNSTPSTRNSSRADPYRRCQNTFIDLGTNIGDSIGYFVDNAIDVCSSMWVDANPKTKFNADFPRPHLDVTTLDFKHRGSKPNPLFGLLQRQTRSLPSATSESFCVYGMEGNPVFTDRLTKLQNFISDMNPRPVQHLHIFTESVVTAKNGPTKLYLDKTSVEQNVSNAERLIQDFFP